MSIIRIIKEFCSVFLPFQCHACRADCDFLNILCEKCRCRLEKSLIPPELASDVRFSGDLYTMSSYDSFLADIIRIIKYRPSKKLLDLLLREVEKKIISGSFIRSDDVIIPVPMHFSRQQKRGFNQAEIIAERIAAFAGARFSPALQRIRATRPQADCNEEERLSNLENAFSLAPGLIESAFSGRRLILVDDVATTGTTLQQCASCLENLNPSSVTGLVISHSYRRQPEP